MPRPSSDNPVNGRQAAGAPARFPIWDDVFPALTPLESQRFLDLASDQGIFHPDEPHEEHTIAEEFRSFLECLFDPRRPFTPAPLPLLEPVTPFDHELDGPQRDAVARSLNVPDLLLLQGLPGTGKSRVITEIIRQHLARRQSVLFLGAEGRSVDEVLTRCQEAEVSTFVRLLLRDERPTGPVSEKSSSHLRNARRAEMIQRALDGERKTVTGLEQLRQSLTTWEQIDHLAVKFERLTNEQTALAQENLSEAVHALAGTTEPEATCSFTQALRSLEETTQRAIAELDGRLTSARAERDRLSVAMEPVRAELQCFEEQERAGKSSRFWTRDFWKSRSNRTIAEQVADVRTALDGMEQVHRDQIEVEESLSLEVTRLTADAANERNRLIDAEIQCRTEAIHQRNEALTAQIQSLRHELQTLSGEIGAGSICPDHAASQLGRANAQRCLDEQTQEADFARRWREYLESNHEVFLRRWRRSIPLVAGPIGSLFQDNWLADLPAFDLLILEDAERLREPEILAAARRARRWILIGKPPAPVSGGVRAELFSRLWDRLNHDVWSQTDGRACCRMLPVSPADRTALERETVTDRPDVELLIRHADRETSELVEVRFGPANSMAEAFAFLLREMAELPWPGSLRTAEWSDTPQGPIVHFGKRAESSTKGVEVERGVRIHAARTCLDGFAIAFTASEGWNRSQAEDWLAQRLRLVEAGRTCRLETNHRQTPAMAAWLNEAVHPTGRYHADATSEGAIQFEPVPRRAPTGARRGGAGLEINLANVQHRELLPDDVEAVLPRQGYVNLLEAQAVVELLRRLPVDHKVAVSSPYPAQLTLLRRLLKNSEIVVSPEELPGRQVDILIVSLTRSHVSRAVTYGDDPSILTGLFNQPRCRIIFVGDPGSVARRAQWQGGIDHLNEEAGERERRWVNALMRFVPVHNGPTTQPRSAATVRS